MTTAKADVPLFVRLELTPEQQRRIHAQTGQIVTAIPIETHAASVRCRFGGIQLDVPRGAFIPTPSSERTFETALAVAAEGDLGPVVVDVGTGVGAIALGLAHALPRSNVFGTDVSSLALSAARRNRARLGLRNVRFATGSLLSPIPKRLHGGVDVLVANVPYLPPSRRAEASRAFPDGTAVGPEVDGLGLVRQLLRRARTFLRPGASLVLQIGDDQWPAVAREAVTLGYSDPLLSKHDGPGPVPGRLFWSESLIRDSAARQEFMAMA